MTSFTISYNDALRAIKMFHALPDHCQIEILPDDNIAQKYVDLFDIVMRALYSNNNYQVGSINYNNGPTKIPAIKQLRQDTGCGLKESKMVIDDLVTISNPDVSDFKKLLDQHGVNY